MFYTVSYWWVRDEMDETGLNFWCVSRQAPARRQMRRCTDRLREVTSSTLRIAPVHDGGSSGSEGFGFIALSLVVGVPGTRNSTREPGERVPAGGGGSAGSELIV